MFSLKSGNGQAAATIRTNSGELMFEIDGDGRLTLVTSKPFESTLRSDGTFSLQITARSENEIARSFEHAAAKLKMTVEELIAKTVEVTGCELSRPPGVVMHRLAFGGLECSRSMMKSALVLWSVETGNSELQKPCYDEARRFVLDGNLENQATLTAMDERFIAGYVAFSAKFDPLFNYIAVASNESGKVKAYFSLYGLYAICMTLARTGGVAKRRALFISNPLDTAQWSEDAELYMYIDVDWMDQAQQSDDLALYKEKLNRMGAFHQRFARERMVKTTIEDIWKSQFPDLPEIDIENGMPVIAEISSIISQNLADLPRSKPMTFEDLMQIVRRRSKNRRSGNLGFALEGSLCQLGQAKRHIEPRV